MDRIQKFFERIAGIPQEADRRERIVISCATPRLDAEALRLPACWRRRAMVRYIKR